MIKYEEIIKKRHNKIRLENIIMKIEHRVMFQKKLKEWKVRNYKELPKNKWDDFFRDVDVSLGVERSAQGGMSSLDVSNKIRHINVELTSKCSSNCKFCGRQLDCVKYAIDLPFETFKKLPIEMLSYIVFEGTLGDPAHYPYFMDAIDEVIKRKRKKLAIRIHTNGNIHDEEWWKTLGQKLKFHKSNIVMFGVDGLKDTHALHRKGTNFDRIVRNIKAFTSAGGNAGINMIVFKHNEHQIEDLKKLSEKLGCNRFQARLSKKYDKELKKPEKFKMKSRGEINEDQKKENFPIVCAMFHNYSLFLTVDGLLIPCFRWHSRRSFWKNESEKARNCYWSNIPYMNLNDYDFFEIMKNDFILYLRNNLENIRGCDGSCRFLYDQYFKRL